MAKGVWIVAEQRDGAFRKISFELASTARKLADALGDEVCAVLCGSGIEGIAGQLGRYGVDRVFVADAPALEPYTTDGHAAAVAKVVGENEPAILLLGASTQGKDLSARLVGKTQDGHGDGLHGREDRWRETPRGSSDVRGQDLRRGGDFHLPADGLPEAERVSDRGNRKECGRGEVRSRPRWGSDQDEGFWRSRRTPAARWI